MLVALLLRALKRRPSVETSIIDIMKKILLTLAAMALAANFSHAQVIALWTFEGETLNPEDGTGVATLGTGGSQSFPAGWGSMDSWSSNGWDVNDYFQFQVSTVGFSNIGVQWEQMGSNTGPAHFALAYSLDGVTFTNFGTYGVTNDGWNTTVTPAESVKGFDLSSITELNEAETVYFRLVMTDTISINGGTVASTGTARVDNFTVTVVPEPGTVTLVGVGLAAVLFGVRRRRD